MQPQLQDDLLRLTPKRVGNAATSSRDACNPTLSRVLISKNASHYTSQHA